MLDRSDSNSISAQDQSPSLDSAIEQCVLELEKSVHPDINALIERFPEWKEEITEFLENWGGMERFAALVGDREPVDPSELPDDERRFGDYELLEKIGIGGMGVIYKARQVSLDRIVALKMILRVRHNRERFRMEAESAASLSHPNIVSIYEIGEHEKGRPFFSMQLIEGCDLKEYLSEHPISSTEAARITETVARAVHYAHQRGILHRDLKPANVLMDANGQPHITDFGLAKPIERDTELTRTGMIMGTPGYMSPEQASGKVKNLTIATDVYGLGAILYSLLTGDAPFTGDSSLELLRRVVDERPTSPRARKPGLERDIETVCMKCLEKSPERRYASPQLLADDLSRFLNNQPVKARPVSTPERIWRWCGRNPAIATLTGAVAALLIATTITAVSLAISERNSRLLSQENSRREAGLNSALNQALDRATQERANLLMTNGLWRASNQNVGEALPWFSEASKLYDKNPEQVRSNLIRCQSWLREHPMPIAAVVLGQKFFGDAHHDNVSFQPNGSAIMNRVGRQVVVWDYERDSLWNVSESFPNMSTATWSPDGKSLIVGLDDGRVVRANPVSRRSETITPTDSAVFEIKLVNHDRWLAIATANRIRFMDVATQKLVQQEFTCKRKVRKMITNSTGTRLVAIDYGSTAYVVSIDGVEMDELFDFHCQYYNVKDGERLLWPKFVKNDQALLARLDTRKIETLDVDSGERLGDVILASPTYSLSVAGDGQSFVSGCFNYAQHYRFSGLRAKKKSEDNSNSESTDPRLRCVPDFRFPHDNVVISTAMNNKGLVATAGWNNEVRLWNTEPLKSTTIHFDVPEKVVPEFVLPHQTKVRHVELSPDCTCLVTIQIDGLVRLWKIPDVETNGYDISAPPGGSLVKQVGEDQWLKCGMTKWTGHMIDATIHRTKDGSIVHGIPRANIWERGHLLDSDLAPNKKQMATIHAGVRRGEHFRDGNGLGGWLRFWSMPDGKLIHDPIAMPSEPRWVAYHPHENRLAVLTCLMQIVIVDTLTFEIKDIWESIPKARRTLSDKAILPANAINEQIEFSPDGHTLISWSSRKPGMWIWNYSEGELRLPKIANQELSIGGFAFSKDGKKVAIAGGDNPVARVLDLETGNFACDDMVHGSGVHSVSFSPDGQRLITGCRDGHARVFDWESGELLLKEISHDGAVVDAAFTPDSNFIVTLGRDNQLRVWNANDGSLALRPFSVPAGSSQLVISPDSRYVIAAGGDIRVTDLGELQSEPQLDLETARQISEILANKTISGGALVTLSTDEWKSKWQKFSTQRFPK